MPSFFSYCKKLLQKVTAQGSRAAPFPREISAEKGIRIQISAENYLRGGREDYGQKERAAVPSF